ncbi:MULTISPECIES: hypothetical protein [Streptomyces]|uniref:Uncharacterized protein n=2 Tax=Streptomyces TaxID=1883 RepID=A0A646KWX1_STRJU|nr:MULTISPECIES: hypothetical protein [Streptomyces]MQS39712.1 hypothetical protein [Streptomyces katsurahamanus]MQT05506.1 hypothetical protein [Streptomyces jumonjinensis]
MSVISSPKAESRKSGTGRLRRTGTLAVLLLSAALVATGCSSDEKEETVAEASSQAKPAEQGSEAGKGDAVAYAKCMRKNGQPNFPDPQPGGALTLPQGVDPRSDEFKKSDDACKEYRPTKGSGEEPGGGWSSDDQVKYAECMRKNGVPEFPDPNPTEKGMVLGKDAGIDPKSAQFEKADTACKEHKPQGAPGGGPGQGGSGS